MPREVVRVVRVSICFLGFLWVEDWLETSLRFRLQPGDRRWHYFLQAEVGAAALPGVDSSRFG